MYRVLQLALAVFVAGCQTAGPARPPDAVTHTDAAPVPALELSIKPGERPSTSSDEAGLWMMSDKLEARLRSSGRIETDAELNAYVRGIVCRLAPDYCEDIRIYIVRTPHFNASMSPNGSMQVWTGLLLRAENEAQLAYVLGHEVGHYLRRHSVKRWRSLRSTSDFMVFFQIASAAAGVGYVGDIGQLIALGSVFAFSRSQEREADDVGFVLMARAGYAPAEAPRIWEALEAERTAADEPDRFIFFATHPPAEERIETLKQLASAQSGRADMDRGEQRYRAVTSGFRSEWMREELRNRQFESSEVLFDRLARSGYRVGEVRFYQGELFRLWGAEGTERKALEAYQAAIESQLAPPETHRSMGLVYWRLDQHGAARQAFETYLQQSPGASDRDMINSYLEQL